jgi:microsomal dipeptidase-like Zn-dependent dipeptidase
MGRAFQVVVAALALLLGAAAAAWGHSEEMSPAEFLDTIVAAGGGPPPDDQGLTLGYPDATQGAPPDFRAADPAAWYSSASVAPPRLGSSTENRYTLAGGCFRMAPADGEGFLARSGEEYLADASPSESEPFRFQATGLGSYLLLGPDGRFPTAEGGELGAADLPSRRAEWVVEGSETQGFELISRQGGELAAGRTGAVDLDASGDRFELQAAAGCASFPEIAVNATGSPRSSKIRYAQTQGTIDLHSHIMAFEAFGRGLHCGRPWHPLGVAAALVDCPDHAPNGLGGLAANMYVFQDPTRTHHPDGWPTFQGWPTYQWVFTHEQTYYRWIERAWRGGLRLLTLLAVDNSGACLSNVHRDGSPGTESCNEMNSVRRQIKATKEMQAYIDAQAGGPGKGFFRIVRNPFQARKVINRGKLAVVLGIEVSEPLDCGLRNGVPQCDRDEIVTRLDEMYDAGVRQMEIVNKFDNAFSGVAMDGGFQGPVVNTGNKIVTGEFWDVETCTGDDADNTQVSSVPPEAAALIALMPGGSLQLPAYPPPPHCNTKGLTDLGRFLIRQMAKRGMVFDPDHMSVLARSQALDLVAGLRYSGIVSSHSWADRTSYRRIMQLGGVVTPMAPHADEFDDEWESQRELFAEGKRRSRRYGFGFGYGDDMNGFGGPRNPTAGTDAEISYPFASPIDKGVKFDRQQSGTKTYDLNTDGVAHFGQWPDWTEGVRRDSGPRLIRDLRGGSESYLRMWERAVGIRGPHRKPRHGHVQADGMNSIRLGMKPKRLLRSAGQPALRTRGWRWKVRRARGTVGAAFTRRGKVGLVASTARRYRAGGIQPRTSVKQLGGVADHLGGKIWVRETGRGTRFVYGVRGGKVRFVGVGTAGVTGKASRVARFAKLATGKR